MVVPLATLQQQTQVLPSRSGGLDTLDGLDKLVVDHIVTERDLLGLESEWRALEPRMSQVPFVSFDWLIPWWQHLRTRKMFVGDELSVLTFRSRSGELLGVAPLMITHRPSVGPLRFRQLQFFGADPNITEVRGMAVALEHSNLVYATLLDHLRKLPGRVNTVSLMGLPYGNARLDERISTMFAAHVWGSDTVNPVVVLKPTWEAFKSSLSRNMKESLRKCYNAPKRDGLSFDFNVVTRAADVNAALAAFFELHRARSEMPDAVYHRNYFASGQAQRFISEVCARYAQRGALRIFQIKHDDAVIATRIGFVVGDSLYLYYSGYDPAYQQYSVMTTVVAESIQYAIAQGFRTVNLSTGRDVSKTRWSSVEMTFRSVEFAPRSRMGIVKHRTYRAINKYIGHGSHGNWLARLLSRGAGW